MHENFQFAATIITILTGILFARNDIKELRADFRRMEDRIDGRINAVEGELKSMNKAYTEFYAEQRRHDEAIETLKKKN